MNDIERTIMQENHIYNEWLKGKSLLDQIKELRLKLKTMKLEDVQIGDSMLRRDPKDFISRVICAVMVKWGKKQGYNTDLVYSHAAALIPISGLVYAFGSIDSGYKPWVFEKHYDWDKDDFCIMRRKTPLTKEEQEQTTNFCLHLVTISRMYQYLNFVKWLMLVYLGINIFGKKENEHIMYCYNSEYQRRRNLNPELYPSSPQTDLFQLLYTPSYEIIYKSK
jgi:hypothetical protein